jgi:hypothetical protein
MPYIPPHLRPGYVSTYVPPPVKTGARFPTNVNDHATNVVPNNGTRHSPRRNAFPMKKTLKVVRSITPNAAPAYKPSHRVKNWPDAFRKYAISKIGKTETRKSKKKCKGTRKGRKGKCLKKRTRRH